MPNGNNERWGIAVLVPKPEPAADDILVEFDPLLDANYVLLLTGIGGMSATHQVEPGPPPVLRTVHIYTRWTILKNLLEADRFHATVTFETYWGDDHTSAGLFNNWQRLLNHFDFVGPPLPDYWRRLHWRIIWPTDV